MYSKPSVGGELVSSVCLSRSTLLPLSLAYPLLPEDYNSGLLSSGFWLIWPLKELTDQKGGERSQIYSSSSLSADCQGRLGFSADGHSFCLSARCSLQFLGCPDSNGSPPVTSPRGLCHYFFSTFHHLNKYFLY